MAKLEVVPKQPDLWTQLRAAAEDAAREEPRLASQLNARSSWRTRISPGR